MFSGGTQSRAFPERGRKIPEYLEWESYVRHSKRYASKNSAESWEWSVLTLGSLCLPCCVRDTA